MVENLNVRSSSMPALAWRPPKASKSTICFEPVSTGSVPLKNGLSYIESFSRIGPFATKLNRGFNRFASQIPISSCDLFSIRWSATGFSSVSCFFLDVTHRFCLKICTDQTSQEVKELWRYLHNFDMNRNRTVNQDEQSSRLPFSLRLHLTVSAWVDEYNAVERKTVRSSTLVCEFS